MTPEELTALAKRICVAGEKMLPSAGGYLVVTLTDANGRFVGVAANTSPLGVQAILEAALAGASRKKEVIDVTGETLPEEKGEHERGTTKKVRSRVP